MNVNRQYICLSLHIRSMATPPLREPAILWWNIHCCDHQSECQSERNGGTVREIQESTMVVCESWVNGVVTVGFVTLAITVLLLS